LVIFRVVLCELVDRLLNDRSLYLHKERSTNPHETTRKITNRK